MSATVPAVAVLATDAWLAGQLSGVPGAETWTATVAASEPDPDDGLRDDLTPQDVTPGVLGFLVIFVAALACIPLFLSMTSKLRRVERRRRQDEEGLPDGAEARAGGTSPDAGDGSGQGASPVPPETPAGPDGSDESDGPARP